MSAPPRLRFVQQLGLLGLSVAAPLLALICALSYLYSGIGYKLIEADVAGQARTLADRLDGELGKIVVAVQMLSKLAEAGVELDRIQRQGGETGATRNLKLRLYDLATEPGPNAAFPSLAMSMDRRSADGDNFTADTPKITDLVSDPEAGQILWKVIGPIRKGEHLTGLVEAAASPSLISEFLKSAALPESWQWAVFDGHGSLVARSAAGQPRPNLIGAPTGTEGVNWTTDSEGRSVVRGQHRLTKANWVLAIGAPTASVETPLRNAWLLFGLGTTILLFFALGLATLLAHRLDRDMRGLGEAVIPGGQGFALVPRFATSEFQDLYDKALREAAERIRGKEQLDWLTLELQHRTNNLLAVVSSIARHTLLNGRSIADARQVFLGRLHALANASASVAQANWVGAEITDVIDKEMSEFQGRFSATGPQVLLSPQAAQNVSLIIHELVTNAFRHGSLSSPGGHVAITWRLSDGTSSRQLEFQWVERGGPLTLPPARQGFGTTLLQTGLTVSAAPELRFEAQGFTYRTHLPLEGALEEAA